LEEEKIHIATLLKNVFQDEDQHSFEKLFKIFYQRLLNFCMYYIKHKESAEEIVSDIFVNLWMKRKELDHIRNLEAYLFIAVKNHSLNHIRQFSNYRVTYLEDDGIHALVNTNDPEKELEMRELIFKMDEAVNSLPPQCKIIFNLIKEEGLKYKEVAEILNLSPRTVETQLVRAMKKLDKILSPYLSSQRHPKDKIKVLPLIRSVLFSIIFSLGL
jgi:RNA polymerase sigma-70 factor (ECF subfamily)